MIFFLSYCRFELAVAHYTGEGVKVENTEYAVRLFRQAAHLGHAGAAYMLGECLLEGIGCKEPDRANALEWIVTAAELGHARARQRVIIVLQEDHERIDQIKVEEGRREEALKWLAVHGASRDVNLERRHTVGGSSFETARRRTKVDESRQSG